MSTTTEEPANVTLENVTSTEFPSSTSPSEISTSTTTAGPTTPKPMGGAEITGIVIAVVVFIVIVTAVAFFILRRRRKLNKNKPPPPILPSAYEVGTRYKQRESDSDPNYVDPEPRLYINQEGVNNPAFDGDVDGDEQDENYEIPVQSQERGPLRSPQPGQAQAAEVDDDEDAGDYVNPGPKQEEDEEDYEIPETNRQQQQEEEKDGDNHSGGDYFDMTQTRHSVVRQSGMPHAEAAPPPPPCKPAKNSGYVNEQVDSDVHPGPSLYQNLSLPNLSGPASTTGRKLRPTGASVHGNGSGPQGRGRGGRPHFHTSSPQGVAKEAPPLVEEKNEDEDSHSYENVPEKKQRSAKR